MLNRKLASILTLALLATPEAAGCAQDPNTEPTTSQAQTEPKKTEEPKKAEEPTGEDGLIPTDDPNVFKTTKPLPRPSEAASYQKPEYPKSGYENTFKGAEEVALYLEDLVTYSYSTGDNEDLKAICMESSEWCATNIRGVAVIATVDSWYLFSAKPKVTKTGVGIPPKENNKGSYSVRVEVEIAKHTHFSTKKEVFEKIDAKRLRRYINLDYQNGRWVVVAVDSEVIE